MTEGYVTCDAVKIHYAQYGGGENPPLVLLHGNGEDGTIFHSFAEKMSAYFTVYAPDTRSHGKSGKAPLSYSLMAGDCKRFITELNLVKPALYGFSDGGITGLISAYTNPGLLSKIAVSGVNLNPGALNSGFRAAIRLAHFFTRNEKLRLMLKEPDIRKEDLALINIPALILAGENDIIKREHSEAVAAAIPGAQLKILEKETHASYVTDGNKLFRALGDFLCP